MFECVGYLPCTTKTGKHAFWLWGVSVEALSAPGVGKKIFSEFVFDNQFKDNLFPAVGQVFEVRWSDRVNPATKHSYVQSIEF